MNRLIISSVLVLYPMFLQAELWACKNDVEIHCTNQQCTVSETHTPMDVTIDLKGKLTACAYSGCWQAKGVVLKHQSLLVLSVSNAKWSGDESSRQSEDLVFVLDKKDEIGYVKVADFAHPMVCHQL